MNPGEILWHIIKVRVINLKPKSLAEIEKEIEDVGYNKITPANCVQKSEIGLKRLELVLLETGLDFPSICDRSHNIVRHLQNISQGLFLSTHKNSCGVTKP